MKFRKLFVFLIISMTIIFIYFVFNDNKVYYLALGDSLARGVTPYGKEDKSYTDYLKEDIEKRDKLETFVKEYTKSGYTITDILNDLDSNKKIVHNNKTITLDHALIKADLVTISIGANDVIKRIKDYDKLKKDISIDSIKFIVDETMYDLDVLLKEIRSKCKEEIILVGYYNPLPEILPFSENDTDKLFAYINDEMRKTASKYNIHYIDIYPLFKSNKEFLPNKLDIHPNLDGYKAIENEIIKYIDVNKLI